MTLTGRVTKRRDAKGDVEVAVHGMPKRFAVLRGSRGSNYPVDTLIELEISEIGKTVYFSEPSCYHVAGELPQAGNCQKSDGEGNIPNYGVEFILKDSNTDNLLLLGMQGIFSVPGDQKGEICGKQYVLLETLKKGLPYRNSGIELIAKTFGVPKSRVVVGDYYATDAGRSLLKFANDAPENKYRIALEKEVKNCLEALKIEK